MRRSRPRKPVRSSEATKASAASFCRGPRAAQGVTLTAQTARKYGATGRIAAVVQPQRVKEQQEDAEQRQEQ
ncbi:hypothetical protein NHJ13051_007221 [Beauveria bassiana]